MKSKAKKIVKDLEKKIEENDSKLRFCIEHKFTLEKELHHRINRYLSDLRFEIKNEFEI